MIKSLTILTIGAVLVLLGLTAISPREVISVANAPTDDYISPLVVRMAYKTGYSSVDSCHYPKGDGCLTASGKIAQYGMVACHKKYPFGTQFVIDNETFTCEDRYADYLDTRRVAETIDIFMGYGVDAHTKAKQVGLKLIEVGIIPK